MKNLLTLISILLFFSCSTVVLTDFENYNNSTGEFFYENVIQVEGENNSSDFIYDKLHKWIVFNYVSSNDVIQLEDKENKILIVKGNFVTNLFGKEGWYSHTLELNVKDGRYKYSLTVHSYKSIGTGKMYFNSNSMGFKNKIFTDVGTKVNSTISNMINFVEIEKIKQTDDW